MARHNAKLAALALERLDRRSKSAFVPADSAGIAPVAPGAPMPPGGGGEIPPEVMAAMGGGGMPPGAAPPGAAPPGAGPPGGGPGGPVPDAGEASASGSIGEQLASVNSKLDQLIGVLNGFLMGQQAGGGSKGGGSKAGGNDQMMAMLQQISQALGVQPQDPNAAAGGMPVMGSPLGGMTAGMPGSPMAGPAGPAELGGPPTGGGMITSASDTAPKNDIAALIKNLRK